MEGGTSVIIYNLYSAFLSGRFKSSTQDFSGLYPGCGDQTAEALLKSLGVPYKMDYCGAVSVWQYMGNNTYPEAKSTQLFFVASRLESITIVFDNSPAIWKRLQAQISAKYGKFDWDINHGSWRVTAEFARRVFPLTCAVRKWGCSGLSSSASRTCSRI